MPRYRYLTLFLLFAVYQVTALEPPYQEQSEEVDQNEWTPPDKRDCETGVPGPNYYLPNLYQMMQIVSQMPRSDWNRGIIAIQDLFVSSTAGTAKVVEMLCRPNQPHIKIPVKGPNVADRALMGIAEKTLGDTVGETVGGNPSIIIGFKYIPPGGSTSDKVGRFLNPPNQFLSPEMLASVATSESQNLINMHRTTQTSEHFGSLMGVTVVPVRGGMSITSLRFQNISFSKAEGEETFSGTDKNGRHFRLYCAGQF